ncbi:MAG: aldo/keto reductase, partial [Sphingomonadales bacterium]|nr:aldo/keto reductase [Sphingomonadales bacterium]
SGILATGTKGSAVPHFNYAPAPVEIIDRVRRIEALCEIHGVDLRAAALQFPLAHQAVASVVPGLGRAAHLMDTMILINTVIPSAFWQDLKHHGLIHADAPVPGGNC